MPVGAVLCGGASRRMGRDKSLIEVDGRSLAERAATACRAAGCDTVLAIGGDASALAAAGLAPVADEYPGEGPLGGILTALDAAGPADEVVIVPVDVPDLAPASIRRLLTALSAHADADVAVSVDLTGRRHHLHAAWRQRARPPLARAFGQGERAVKRALDRLTVVEVAEPDPASLVDVDTPEDLARWRATRGNPDRER